MATLRRNVLENKKELYILSHSRRAAVIMHIQSHIKKDWLKTYVEKA